MKNSIIRVQIAFGLLLAAAFALVWHWQSPGESARLTPQQVDAYVDRIAATLQLEPDEADETLTRLRAWGKADDGRPVHMLNLMRYHDAVRPLPGRDAPRTTPRESNAHYERQALPLLLGQGGYAQSAGEATGVPDSNGVRRSNLMFFDQGADDWDRVLVIRYPSRRAFFELLSDPRYAPLLPYKLGALRVALVPIAPQQPLPDFLWSLGLALLALFCAVGWIQSARRDRLPAAHAHRGGAEVRP